METETVTGTQASKPKKGARDWYTKYKNCLLCIIANKWSTQQSPSRTRYCIAQKVHPLLITKISDLMSSNICDLYEVKNITQTMNWQKSLALNLMSMIMHFIQIYSTV